MVRSARGLSKGDWRGDGHRYQSDFLEGVKVAKMPPITLTEREIGDYGALVGHMEITRDEHGNLRFVCPRCRQVWSAGDAPSPIMTCDMLIAHLAKHGVQFSRNRRGHPGAGS